MAVAEPAGGVQETAQRIGSQTSRGRANPKQRAVVGDPWAEDAGAAVGSVPGSGRHVPYVRIVLWCKCQSRSLLSEGTRCESGTVAQR